MQLKPCRKAYRNETQRAVAPEETLSRVEPKAAESGITRIADITNLDRIGIPVFSCMRPTALEGAISVYNGKGATPVEARVSAVMEGIERFSAEPGGRKTEFGTYGEISGSHLAVFPGDLVLPENADPDRPLPWFPAFDLVSGLDMMVPAHAVFHPAARSFGPFFRTNTNGIASGNTLEEAVFHALAEIIERDAWSLAEVTRNTGPRVTGVEGGLAGELLGKFEAAGVNVVLRNITSDLGIPTIAAAADDPVLRDPALLTIGMGTHTNAGIAVLRALTEVAQSRLTQIHGAREDTTEANFRRQIGYDRVKRLNRYWYEAQEDVGFQDIHSCDTDDFLDDIKEICNRLVLAGMDRVLVADLTREGVGVPVVRVIVPGLEVFAMDQERMGKRCRDARSRRVSRAKPAA